MTESINHSLYPEIFKRKNKPNEFQKFEKPNGYEIWKPSSKVNQKILTFFNNPYINNQFHFLLQYHTCVKGKGTISQFFESLDRDIIMSELSKLDSIETLLKDESYSKHLKPYGLDLILQDCKNSCDSIEMILKYPPILHLMITKALIASKNTYHSHFDKEYCMRTWIFSLERAQIQMFNQEFYDKNTIAITNISDWIFARMMKSGDMWNFLSTKYLQILKHSNLKVSGKDNQIIEINTISFGEFIWNQTIYQRFLEILEVTKQFETNDSLQGKLSYLKQNLMVSLRYAHNKKGLDRIYYVAAKPIK